MIRWRIDHIHQGLKLRSQGLSYGSIAVVLREYHDLPEATEATVRYALRTHGALPNPRGRCDHLPRGRFSSAS